MKSVQKQIVFDNKITFKEEKQSYVLGKETFYSSSKITEQIVNLRHQVVEGVPWEIKNQIWNRIRNKL